MGVVMRQNMKQSWISSHRYLNHPNTPTRLKGGTVLFFWVSLNLYLPYRLSFDCWLLHRYNWFTTYASDPLGFGSGALNVPNWEDAGDGKGCQNREFVSNAKPGFSWGIEEIHECVTLSRQKSYCHLPLRISFDNDNCYCSSDACDTVVNTWAGMKTYRELTDQPSDVSSLSASGVRYNSFGVTATSEPTSNPTTAQPTNAPTTAEPTAHPTLPPTPAPTNEVRHVCLSIFQVQLFSYASCDSYEYD